MKDTLLSRPLRIKDRRAAAAFSDPLRRRIVLLFAAGPSSLARMAELSGVELKRLHYHVTVLQKLRLLAVAHKQRRGGRPIRIYKSVAAAFFVPEALAPLSRSQALTTELQTALAKRRDPAGTGTLYSLNDHNQPQMRIVQNPAPAGAPHAEHWRVLSLSRAGAARLAAAIDTCLKSGIGGDDGSRDDYLIHFAMAPRAAKNKSPARRR